MSNATETHNSIQFCIRSYIAFVLAPEAPVIDWLDKLDNWTINSPGFFNGKPIVLDLSALKLSQSGIGHLVEQLAERGIRVIGLEGVDVQQLSPSLPPLLAGGRTTSERQDGETQKQDAPTPGQDEPTSLLIATPVRSGQTVIFPNGDVTVLGSVASGSEIVAGGSIHVYGTLRGRALAGSKGDNRARIFCRKNEAELLAINGYYRTADELDDTRRQPVQTWLEDGVLMVAPLE